MRNSTLAAMVATASLTPMATQAVRGPVLSLTVAEMDFGSSAETRSSDYIRIDFSVLRTATFLLRHCQNLHDVWISDEKKQHQKSARTCIAHNATGLLRRIKTRILALLAMDKVQP